MNLIRIGRDVLNMDRVLTMYDAGDRLRVLFGHGEHSNQHHEVSLTDGDRDALLSWLGANATNLTPKNELDEEWEAYKEKGGTMPRPAFEKDLERLREINRQLCAVDVDEQTGRWETLMDAAADLEKRVLF